MILRTQAAAGPLAGELAPPGDKSISHRSLILGTLASGETRVDGLLEGEDVLATAEACRQLGAEVIKDSDTWVVQGVGERGLSAPAGPLDMGNSGTAMRLLAGVLAAQPFESELFGDSSLNGRPMNRIVKPLRLMGAEIETRDGGLPPLKINGNAALHGISYDSPVASAQVKSCLLLAGLYAKGETQVREPLVSRDHTEKMLPSFGVDVMPPCGVRGGARLIGTHVQVPADISSATFFMVAAALVPGSDVLLRNVGLNETRDGIIHVLQAMGVDLLLENERFFGSEPVADIRVRYSGRCRGTDIPEHIIPRLIDELPAIFALAATADGTTRLRGAEELRVKESDRIAVMARGLERLGVELQEYPDGIDIHGGSVGAGEVDGAGDHRCAMSFCVLGQVAAGEVRVSGSQNINTSYPQFTEHLLSLGGQVSRA